MKDLGTLIRVFEDGTISFLSVQEQNIQEEERQRRVREDCPEKEAITRLEVVRLLQRDARMGTPGESYRKLQAFHWQEAPELPRYASDIPSPKLDNLFAHEERVQRNNPAGSFCGQPIVGLDELGMEVDNARDTTNRVAVSSGTSTPAEILPGEERCADGIIRRSTAAEVVGYDTYHNQEAIEAGQKRVSMAEARQASKDGAMVHYRPNRFVGEGEYALVEVQG